jgi:hypothetical protein
MSEAARAAASSIELYLNPLLRRQDALRGINEALVAGRLVVIRDAFHLAFAERMFRCLDDCTEWKLHEHFEDHFHFHHHNLYDPQTFPPDLAWCRRIFESEPTKGFVHRLSGRDCSGGTPFSASWYLPGDHSLPHCDLVKTGEDESRQLAFVWHLTRDWRPAWGGAFFWCATSRYLAPSFNTLLLFAVGHRSYHFVTHVSPYARSKRLAINGWWTGRGGGEACPEGGRPDGGEAMIEFV